MATLEDAYYGKTQNQVRAATRPASRSSSSRSRGYRSSGRSSGYHGGTTRSYSGGGRATGFRTSRPVQSISRNVTRPQPRRPSLPVPSADSIAALFNQIAGLKRNTSQLQGAYNLSRSQLSNARGLYLQQLADAFQQSRTSSLEDYATRGLANSGIAHEGLARLENEYQGQVSGYNTNYNDQLAQLLQTLQGNVASNASRRQALEAQYNRLRAQRAAALKLAGFGG